MTAIRELTSGFGVIRYNGYTFGPLRQASIESAVVYDGAERTRVYSRRMLRVQAIINSEALATQNVKMKSLLDALEEPGKKLEIEDIGFYEAIDTSATGTTPDLVWGAKPRVVSAKPLSGDLAWEIIWTCEFNVRSCASGQINPQAFVAFNYETFYSISEVGLTTRRIVGYFEIAQQRASDELRTVAYNLEDYFDRIEFALPFAFKRVSAERHLAGDGRRLNFSVVDQEIDGEILPAGIVAADVDYTFRNTPPGFIRWGGTLSGTLEVAPGYSKSIAAEKFFLILFDRISKLRATADALGGIMLPQSIEFGGSVYGRTTHFAVSFMLVAALDDLVSRSGVWAPVPGSDYATWRASMQAVGIGSMRGRIQARHDNADDVIIDLCSETTSVSIGNDTINEQAVGGSYTAGMSCLAVPKERSWVNYRNVIRAIVDQDVAIQKPMQKWSGVQEQTPAQSNGLTMPLGVPKEQIAKELLAQYQGPPQDLVLMQGDGLRLNYSPDVPRLVTVAGAAVEELGRRVVAEPVGNFFGCALYSGRWAILYRVRSSLSGVNPPRNQFMRVQQGENDGI